MRLDRYDGVGETAWTGDHCVAATLEGFREAVNMHYSEGRCDDPAYEKLIHLPADTGLKEWAEIFSIVRASYDPNAPDYPVIEKNLADHIFLIYSLGQKA
jgi:hypothetical protein